MKKGISIWSFAETDLDKIFALAADAGFQGVELALAEDGPVNLNSKKRIWRKSRKVQKSTELSFTASQAAFTGPATTPRIKRKCAKGQRTSQENSSSLLPISEWRAFWLFSAPSVSILNPAVR